MALKSFITLLNSVFDKESASFGFRACSRLLYLACVWEHCFIFIVFMNNYLLYVTTILVSHLWRWYWVLFWNKLRWIRKMGERTEKCVDIDRYRWFADIAEIAAMVCKWPIWNFWSSPTHILQDGETRLRGASDFPEARQRCETEPGLEPRTPYSSPGSSGHLMAAVPQKLLPLCPLSDMPTLSPCL